MKKSSVQWLETVPGIIEDLKNPGYKLLEVLSYCFKEADRQKIMWREWEKENRKK
jgi:hypothetical protein